MGFIEATNLHCHELVGALLEGKAVKEALAGLDRFTLRHSSTHTSMISGTLARSNKIMRLTYGSHLEPSLCRASSKPASRGAMSENRSLIPWCAAHSSHAADMKLAACPLP